MNPDTSGIGSRKFLRVKICECISVILIDIVALNNGTTRPTTDRRCQTPQPGLIEVRCRDPQNFPPELLCIGVCYDKQYSVRLVYHIVALVFGYRGA